MNSGTSPHLSPGREGPCWRRLPISPAHPGCPFSRAALLPVGTQQPPPPPLIPPPPPLPSPGPGMDSLAGGWCGEEEHSLGGQVLEGVLVGGV